MNRLTNLVHQRFKLSIYSINFAGHSMEFNIRIFLKSR